MQCGRMDIINKCLIIFLQQTFSTNYMYLKNEVNFNTGNEIRYLFPFKSRTIFKFTFPQKNQENTDPFLWFFFWRLSFIKSHFNKWKNGASVKGSNFTEGSTDLIKIGKNWVNNFL